MGAVWCGVVVCGVVVCGAVVCGVVRCGVVRCGVVLDGEVRCESGHGGVERGEVGMDGEEHVEWEGEELERVRSREGG